MLLRHSPGLEREAGAVEASVDKAITSNVLTKDLGGSATTVEAGTAVLGAL